MRRSWVFLGVALAMLTSGCGGSGEEAAPSPSTSASSTTRPVAIMGQWTAKVDCRTAELALAAAGLRRAEAAYLLDYFPSATAQQLAKKSNICEGAPAPAQHSHFFTAAGLFGSLDQSGKQVDDGIYVVTASELYICASDAGTCSPANAGGHFKYAITGEALSLEPVITPAQKAEALDHPLDFKDAGWMVSLARAARVWQRTECVPCG